jgi:hypothetical protein
MQLDRAARLQTLSVGLDLLAENVAEIRIDASILLDARRPRGLEIVTAQAEEEAAKFLILLDLMRVDQRDEAALARHLGHFYNHLSRWIYAEVAHMSPANFAEVRRMVETMRPSHFLDGPTGADWIFRNRLMARREEALYVDLIHDDDGDRWVGPGERDALLFGGPSPAVASLIGSLHRVGATSSAGLEIVSCCWSKVELADDTHWQEVRAINFEVTEMLADAGLARDDLGEEDVGRVVECWGFPLAGLDLSELPVSAEELERERQAVLADFC